MSNFYSPLRYPGRKQKLSGFIRKICADNDISGHYVEPYAGGAAVALSLLLTGRVEKITINDLDKAVYAFWWSVINESQGLCKLICDTEVTVEEWQKQKEIFADKTNEDDLLKLGFSTLFLNRTNYSGVLNAGVIGGIKQGGKYEIGCRFNKKTLIDRIQAISSCGGNINVTNLDALDLIDVVENNVNTIFYFDPPYYLKGQSLYMNHYKKEDHRIVSEKIWMIKNPHWIVSYDNTPQIHELYDLSKNSFNYELHHRAHSSRVGKESIFFSDSLVVSKDAKGLLIKG